MSDGGLYWTNIKAGDSFFFYIFWQVKVEVGVFENMAGSPNGNIQSESAK